MRPGWLAQAAFVFIAPAARSRYSQRESPIASGCKIDFAMFRGLIIALLAGTLSLSLPLAAAQMRGGRSVSHNSVRRGTRSSRGRSSRGGFFASPYLYSDYYPDYAYDSGEPYPPAAAPPPLVLTQPELVDTAPRGPRPAPLLIEWQGNRYVRFGGMPEAEGEAASIRPDYSESANQPVQKSRIATPAQLVFRDGHREEISTYAIANGIIYVQSGYGQTKTIALSSLDPAATMQANQQTGSKFMLPAAGNEVIASF